jgi:hypothetical protein
VAIGIRVESKQRIDHPEPKAYQAAMKQLNQHGCGNNSVTSIRGRRPWNNTEQM